MRNRITVFLPLLFFVFYSLPNLYGQDDELVKGADSPALDGKIDDGEYGCSRDFGKLRLYLGWKDSSLYAAVSADTTGWVAVGFNSRAMNNAKIIIGYSQGGKSYLRADRGEGHFHKSLKEEFVLDYTVKENGGRTVLEAEIKTDGIILPGDESLDLLVAYGGTDNFMSMHRFRKAHRVTLRRVDR